MPQTASLYIWVTRTNTRHILLKWKFLLFVLAPLWEGCAQWNCCCKMGYSHFLVTCSFSVVSQTHHLNIYKPPLIYPSLWKQASSISLWINRMWTTPLQQCNGASQIVQLKAQIYKHNVAIYGLEIYLSLTRDYLGKYIWRTGNCSSSKLNRCILILFPFLNRIISCEPL